MIFEDEGALCGFRPCLHAHAESSGMGSRGDVELQIKMPTVAHGT